MGIDKLRQIEENVKRIFEDISEISYKSGRNPAEIKLMAVTKKVPAELVNIAIEAGVNFLGENRTNELLEKYENYKLDRENIHFIGHLQSNKVRYVMDKVSLIQSADSIRKAEIIDENAKLKNKIMDILLQVNIGKEESKYGFFEEEIENACFIISKMEHIRIKGFMSIPPINGGDIHFQKMQKLFVDIRDKNIDNIDIDFLSMGMSSDYRRAIFFGSNIVRIGTGIFGERN